MLLALRSTTCAAALENAIRGLVGSAMSNLRIGAWPRYGIAAELLLLAIWPGRRRSRRFRSPVTNRQAEIMMRIAFEFGFTPASRSRIFSYSQKNSMLLEIVDKPYDESSGW
jgi:hypothetical protein